MAQKEKMSRLGLADPRTGGERLLAQFNRAASGNRKAPVRKYDDSPTQMAKNRAASKKSKKK